MSKGKCVKRAMAEESIVFLILGCIALAVMLMAIFNPFKKTADAASEKEICKDSVLMHSKLRIEHVPISKSIKCPTKIIRIEETDSTEIKRKIADLMFDCWDNFGEGRLELFDAQSEKFCVVCSVLSFTEKNIITGFTDFLVTEKVPTHNITYLEYFTGEDSANPEITEQMKTAKQEIDASKKYAVVFTYAKKVYWSRFQKSGLGAVIGVGAGITLAVTGVGAPAGLALIGAGVGGGIGAGLGTKPAEWDAAIILIPEEKIPEIGCTSIPKTG